MSEEAPRTSLGKAARALPPAAGGALAALFLLDATLLWGLFGASESLAGELRGPAALCACAAAGLAALGGGWRGGIPAGALAAGGLLLCARGPEARELAGQQALLALLLPAFLSLGWWFHRLDWGRRAGRSRDAEAGEERRRLLATEIASEERRRESLDRGRRKFPVLLSVCERFSRLRREPEVVDLLLANSLALLDRSEAAALYLAEGGQLALARSRRRGGPAGDFPPAGGEVERLVFARQESAGGPCRLAGGEPGACLATPLFRDRLEGGQVQREPIGVLRVEVAGPEEVGREERELLGILALLGGCSLANARLYQRAEQLAIVDSLTNLYLAHYLNERLDEELQRAGRAGAPLAVFLLDLDDFKGVNDRYGHLAGDEALRRVGGLLGREMERGHLAGRYGGDEFVIVSRHTAPAEAAAWAELLRERIGAAEFLFAGERVRVTATMGAAFFPGDGADRLALLRRADERLYAGKRAGKDRFVQGPAGQERP